MKIGTFVIGGLAGAAIVMMIQRNSRMAAVASSVGSSLKRRMSDMKDEVVEKAKDTRFASSFARPVKMFNSESTSASSYNDRSDSMEKEFISDINSVMEDSGQHRI